MSTSEVLYQKELQRLEHKLESLSLSYDRANEEGSEDLLEIWDQWCNVYEQINTIKHVLKIKERFEK